MKRVSRRELLHAGLALGTFAPACSRGGTFLCTDVSTLSVQQIEIRNKLQYRDQAAKPELACDQCSQYVASPSDVGCGSCKVMPGPAHPQGSCLVFAKKS